MRNKAIVGLYYKEKDGDREIFEAVVEFTQLKRLRGIKYGIKLAAAILLPKVWMMGDLKVIHEIVETPGTKK